ncbi:tyrosine-type recombinase/integrase [Actinoplanes aureus]|uniref:Site-specific integrase n=1 Tax=Actinoplanes aureus TaxID=2792083 RepID=A0A931C5Y1_9ACTN|nr:site-specific integrase [Actinoplanes aureus]MBG0564009.1 site-specific integrase [Actinoplanes aureus]
MSRPEEPATSKIEAVHALLQQLDLSPEQLLAGTRGPGRPVPTFDEYVPQVAAAVTPGTRSLYSTYWQRVRHQWGSRRINEPTALEIQTLAEQARTAAVTRSNSRGGGSAAEHMIAALRCLYRYAIADGLISETANPAARVPKPRRPAATRQALNPDSLAQIIKVAAKTGDDPHLDLLLLRLHLETACRRGGALALRRRDLDTGQCLLWLREKGRTSRWQPISPTLAAALADHHAERGDNDPQGRLLRYRNGRPVGRRRYDYLWKRLGEHLPWVATRHVSAHWLRHTTLTWVERHCGYAVARAYADHDPSSDAGTTATYVKATLEEVARALAALTGESHPLAPAEELRDTRLPLP